MSETLVEALRLVLRLAKENEKGEELWAMEHPSTLLSCVTDSLAALETAQDISERVAQLTAHRACIGAEHDPQNGKLHGCCIVCGRPWPCEYAGEPRVPKRGDVPLRRNA